MLIRTSYIFVFNLQILETYGFFVLITFWSVFSTLLIANLLAMAGLSDLMVIPIGLFDYIRLAPW